MINDSHSTPPCIRRTAGKLNVEIIALPDEDKKLIDIRCVLDFNHHGEVIGIEIINLKHYGGPNVFEGYDWERLNAKSDMRFSYDEECDAFYLRLAIDRSLDQRTVDGKLVLDRQGRLARIEINLDSEKMGPGLGI